MADVFISYSRKDKDFVRRLHEALAKRGRDTWVDWEDIPLSAEWLEEVYSGIEGADTFVFVISPDSVESKICNLELAHAVEHNKRLVPVVRREVYAEDVHPALAAYNWIFFHEGDDFDEAFRALVEAIDTDLDWVRAHTRLLTRAIEWENEGRDKSFLLHGSDLRAAEELLARAAEKEPKPTQLQTEYVLASRNAATKRQRVALGAVTFGLIVAVILGLVALWQRGEAIDQRDEATRQSDIALGRQLTAQAQLEDQEPYLLQRSVLLAAEAKQQSPLPSLEADQILRRGLSLLPLRVASMTHDDQVDEVELLALEKPWAGPAEVQEAEQADQVNQAVFSPDGEYLVTASNDGTARVWEATSGKEVASMPHDGPVGSVAFGPDGEYLVTAGDDGTARVWEATSGREVVSMEHEDRVNGVAFSPDGEYIASSSRGTIRVWEATSGRAIASINETGKLVRGVVFSPDGEYLATASNDATPPTASNDGNPPTTSNDHTARVWEATSGKEVASMPHENPVNEVVFSPDGEYVATRAYHTARVWEAASGKEVASIPDEDFVEGVAFSPDGEYLATASTDRTARVWEATNGQEVASMEGGGSVAFSPDGGYLVTGRDDKTVSVWESTGEREVARAVHEDMVTSKALSPDGKYLATVSIDGTAHVWDLASTHEVTIMTHQGPSPSQSGVHEAVFSPDGEYLATAGQEGTAGIWDPASGKEVASMAHDGPVGSVAFSPDGEHLATASNDGTARVWEAASGREVARMAHDGPVDSVAFSPNGEYLATASTDRTARVWEAASGREVASMSHDNKLSPRGAALVDEAVFSPDGEYLATAGDDGTARVWETASGQEVARMEHEHGVNSVAFSPDGESVASSSRGTTRVWEATSGKEVASMEGSDTRGFSPGGEYLITERDDYTGSSPSTDGTTISIWDVASGHEVASLANEGNVTGVAFSPSGEYLATASAGTTRVWEAAGWQEVARMTQDSGFQKSVQSVAFSPDGEYLATASMDGTARTWVWRQPEDLADEACVRLTLNFSEEEWQEYLGDKSPKACPDLPEPEE